MTEACGGGGVVSTQPGSVGSDRQRVFISVRASGTGGSGAAGGTGATGGAGPTTDVITQIGVPDTTDDYGALLPVPTEPVLDAQPVFVEELDALDRATAPQIVTYEDDSGGSGCGCPVAGGAVSKGGESEGVEVSQPVNIGPVTAVVLTGSTEAVSTWLADNGFAISDADQATIADYSGYYFVAVRRSETAAPGGPTSIGIHFTMPGDHRELPLRFASLGAAPTVAFTLFIAASEVTGPSPPFTALTLGDLNPDIVRSLSYADAVRGEVASRDNQAFVVESRTTRAELSTRVGSRLMNLIGPGELIRLSTIVPSEALTEDAHFYTPYEGEVDNTLYARSSRAPASREAGTGALTALLLLGAWRRREARR